MQYQRLIAVGRAFRAVARDNAEGGGRNMPAAALPVRLARSWASRCGYDPAAAA